MAEDHKTKTPVSVKTRYSDAELAEFKAIIEEKLAQAKSEYNTLREVILHNGTNDIEDTSPSFKTVEDDGANQLSRKRRARWLRDSISLSRTSRLHLQELRTRLMVCAVRQVSLFLRSACALFRTLPLLWKPKRNLPERERISII